METDPKHPGVPLLAYRQQRTGRPEPIRGALVIIAGICSGSFAFALGACVIRLVIDQNAFTRGASLNSLILLFVIAMLAVLCAAASYMQINRGWELTLFGRMRPRSIYSWRIARRSIERKRSFRKWRGFDWEQHRFLKRQRARARRRKRASKANLVLS